MSSTLDQSVECLKNIVDFYRCRICDKVDGSRMRYSCGHTACNNCELEATSCLTCLTPPDIHTYTVASDESLTLRAKNALALKKAFEDTFNIDIYKRHRLSEKLKIEQELFQTPIKASVKYCNKRKSIKIPSINKENLYYPGEQISPSKKMDVDKNSYVQQWLDRTETRPRKPFADLDVNRSITFQSTLIKQRAGLILDKPYEKSGLDEQKSSIKKRTNFKTSLSLVNSQSKLNKCQKPVKKQETTKWSAKKFNTDFDPPEKQLHYKKNYKDESGIVMDEEIISINDSQSVVVDKDKEAWLAVLRAGETDVSEPTPGLECIENIRQTLDVGNTPNTNIQKKKNTSTYNKIPFIKQSSLSEPCQFCNDFTECNQNQTTGQSESVSITIENNGFITTVTVSDNRKTVESSTKESTCVQTDIQALLRDHSTATQLDVADVGKECVKESQDLFTAEVQNENLVDNITVEDSKSAQHKTTTRIQDSDSDDDLNQSSIIEVTADVHKTSDLIDYGVLSELKEKDLGLKTKLKKLRKTPASSDSSEKENFDPNKCKRRKLEKKSKKKKTKRIMSK